jgi:hypothetical protein
VDGLPKDTGDELIAVSVPAGEKLQLDFNIKNSGTQLRYVKFAFLRIHTFAGYSLY